ncbi:MAG: TetR/AcrR family transcriptional regulator, partial [Comamonadaceae bacterium]
MPPHDATPPPPKTRTPRQDRSRTKVDLIVEAAIRILEGEGLAALTTNRIADVAGVSIGTLYQYFRSKEAVVEFLVARELAVVRETAE